MESSSNQGLSGAAHLQQNHNENPYNDFINGIQSYAAAGDNTTNDDYNTFSWDPALFNSDAIGPAYSQQAQSTPSTFTQPISRQSNNSPALPQYQSSQSPYQQPSNYQQPFYDSRNASQPTFDDRFISRPSASPVSFEQFNYQQPISYVTPSYGQMPQQYQQRQSPATLPQYAQRPPQQAHHYMNLAARPQSQLSHVQNADPATAGFHHYPAVQHNTHSFVNPSLLSANGLVNMNGGPGATAQQRQMQSSPYFTKAGATVDPQLLQPMQVSDQQPTTTHTSQQTQQHQFLQQGQTGAQPPTTKVVNGSNGVRPAKAKAPKAKKTIKGANESDSADELEIEDEPPEMTPALLVVSAPTDIRGKALYNAVQAVWSPRNRPVTTEKIRSGMSAWGDTVRSLRDSWKAKNDALIKAELPNSSTAADIPRLKEEVAHYRQVMEGVMSRSLQYGHDSIVSRLAENHFALSALNSFMLDRNRVGDYDSSLVNSIFKFAVKFATLDEEMLETVKWAKILQRFSRKSTTDSQDLAKQILANAAAQSARKRAAKVEEGPASPGSANGSRTSQGGVKRTRDGDSVGPIAKKIVKPASKPLALQHAERRKALEKESALRTADKTGKSAVNDGKSTTATRQKVAMAAPLKNNAFAGLLSASKKPGTSIAEKAAMATKDKIAPASTSVLNEIVAAVKKEEVKKDSPPRSLGPAPTAKTASSFLGFLADMDKPKESEVKKTEVNPNETEEQREKRLRKEKRRKLRVSWKTDSELVETRIFTVDPEEKTGHADSMMRDAGDTGKEGEMLKLHKGVDDLDEDDEDEAVDDLGEYELPSQVDLSDLLVLDGEPSQNFIKTAGPLKPESASSLAQDKYEENTLMAIYVFKSDRPDTPKELPSVNDDEDFSPCVDFGKPDEKTLRREKSIMSIRPQPNQPLTTPGLDLAAQLRAITQQSQPPQQAPAMFNTDLQRTLGMLSQHNQQPTPAPAPSAPTGGLDIARLMAVVQQAKQVQQVQPAPQYTPAPVPTPPAGIPANLAALVAQVTGGQQQTLSMGGTGNPNPYPGAINPARKHGRSDDLDAQGNRKKNKVPVDNEGKPLNYRTQVCSYWQEGKCTRGDNCTYRHDEGAN